NFSITDANLVSGFPFKNGDTTKIGTFCFWYKKTSTGSWMWLISKSYWNGSTGYAAFALADNNGTLEIEYGQGGQTWGDNSTGLTLTNGHWHHITCEIDASGNCHILVYDATNQAFQYWYYAFGAAPYIYTNAFFIGDRQTTSNPLTGNIDELVVFNRLLNLGEITNIINQVYAGPYAAASPGNVFTGDSRFQAVWQ